MREAVIAPTAPALHVMTRADEAIDDVQVQADVLALIEAFTSGTTSVAMPWPALVGAVAGVPSGHPVLHIGSRAGHHIPGIVGDAITDLLTLGLVETGPKGLHITASGCSAARDWNGKYRERLEAAKELLAGVGLLPAAR